jgi:hypothetical protein
MAQEDNDRIHMQEILSIYLEEDVVHCRATVGFTYICDQLLKAFWMFCVFVLPINSP